MDSESPERELEQFLAAQPSWLRKLLQADNALSPEEQACLVQQDWPEIYGQALDKYVLLLGRCPAKLREYRELQKRHAAESAVAFLPALKPGARRLDSFALEAKELEASGLTQADIAAELNKRHPDRRDRKGHKKPFTEEGVRKLLGRRRAQPPDKT